MGLLGSTVTRLPRGFLIDHTESAGPALEHVARAVRELDDHAQTTYPVFHSEMGPVWTSTLQVIYA